MEKLITLTEAAKILGIEEKEIIKLSDEGKITAYRIGGNFLRFKLKDIEEYKKKITGLSEKEIKSAEAKKYFLKDRIYDFFYYYDFYIIVILIIILLIIIILKF